MLVLSRGCVNLTRSVLGSRVDHMRPRHRHGRRGLGLYSANQIRSETPFTLFGVIIVGTVFCFGGIVLFWSTVVARSKEFAASGTADSHVGGFLFALGMFICGIFFAHAGVIYFGRRLLTRVRLRRRERRRVP